MPFVGSPAERPRGTISWATRPSSGSRRSRDPGPPASPAALHAEEVSMRVLTCLLIAALAGGCATARFESPAGTGVAEVRRTESSRCWLVRTGGESVGYLVLFADPSRPDDPGRRYFSVRNRDQQELGTMDAHGRVFRFRPHEREAEWLGTATLPQGVARVLELGGDVDLIEVPLAAVRG